MRARALRLAAVAVVLFGVAGVAVAAPNQGRVVEAVMASEEGGALQAVLESDEGARAVIEDAIGSGIPGWDGMNDAKATETLQLMLGVEVKNLRAAREKVEAIAQLRKRNELAAVVDQHLMDPGDYGADDADAEALKASKWINNASNTTRGNEEEIEMVARILERAAEKNDLRSLADLEAINRVLVNRDDAPSYRGISLAGGKLPSSTGGFHLLGLMLENIDRKERGRNLGAYLYGAIVRCHGFADGNGRTGRAAYAISILKAGKTFRAPTVAGENALHGLDD